MELYLFRHGPTEERDPRKWPDDGKRPLSPKGEEDTKKAARGFATLGPTVDRVITSPAVRAHRTAEWVHGALKVNRPLVVWPELAPDESASGVLARLSGEPTTGKGAVLVGHEPTLGELVGLSLTGEAISLARLSRCGVAALSFSRRIVPSGGELDWLLTRKQLMALAP